MQLAIASSTYRFVYGADCRAYYLGKIAPLLSALVPGVVTATNK
jgi:hypothetical protein